MIQRTSRKKSGEFLCGSRTLCVCRAGTRRTWEPIGWSFDPPSPGVLTGARRMNRKHFSTEILSGALLFIACGSSADEHRSVPGDGGTPDAAPTRNANRGSPGDGSLGEDGRKGCSFGKPECARGQTCCFADSVGTCTDLASCTTTTQFECSDANSCPAGDDCCATFDDWPDGGTTATTFCRKRCALRERAICHTSADCGAGSTCMALPEGARSPIIAMAVESSLAACLPTEGGTGI